MLGIRPVRLELMEWYLQWICSDRSRLMVVTKLRHVTRPLLDESNVNVRTVQHAFNGRVRSKMSAK